MADVPIHAAGNQTVMYQANNPGNFFYFYVNHVAQCAKSLFWLPFVECAFLII